ncbi:MAG TPA: hypothetical protein VFK80_04565, partial [Limnochordia bacterium]|nr:hypothetical protein [Limnochordia bacterium]
LQRLAAETGGRVLKPDDPIFLSTGGRQAGAPLWPLLLSLAALLFTLDIALRYAPESLLANAAALWRGGLGAGERALGRLRPARRERAPGDAPPDAEELLRRRKARAREQRRPPGGGPGVGV